MTQIKIDKGISVPAARAGASRRNPVSAAMLEMDVGDSILIESEKPGDKKELEKARSRATQAVAAAKVKAQIEGKAFTTRVRYVDFDGEEGLRIWRVK